MSKKKESTEVPAGVSGDGCPCPNVEIVDTTSGATACVGKCPESKPPEAKAEEAPGPLAESETGSAVASSTEPVEATTEDTPTAGRTYPEDRFMRGTGGRKEYLVLGYLTGKYEGLRLGVKPMFRAYKDQETGTCSHMSLPLRIRVAPYGEYEGSNVIDYLLLEAFANEGQPFEWFKVDESRVSREYSLPSTFAGDTPPWVARYLFTDDRVLSFFNQIYSMEGMDWVVERHEAFYWLRDQFTKVMAGKTIYGDQDKDVFEETPLTDEEKAILTAAGINWEENPQAAMKELAVHGISQPITEYGGSCCEDGGEDEDPTDSEAAALQYLQKNYVVANGVIHPQEGLDSEDVDDQDEEVIDFLCCEWDYSYDPSPLPKPAEEPFEPDKSPEQEDED